MDKTIQRGVTQFGLFTSIIQVGVSGLLEYNAALLGIMLPTFRNNVVVILEDWTTTIHRNFGSPLPTNTASYTRRTETLATTL
jgi:hypothetical protein